ncbi:LCP family protein [Streptosporangium sp. NPDC087985]|uniref:LCP family protein n=1 Tax=Streptosporangium sp. NPDC087985 TaxID=3366196 RepID=UPI0038104B5F
MAGRVVYGLACAVSTVMLAVSGAAYFVYSDIKSIGSSNAIEESAPKSKQGAVNILLIGLDSRRDQNGDMLPNSILKQLHAGSRRGIENGVGGYNTNTLILLHVPGDGRKATALSIPRDDYVDYVDAIGPQQRGKIKEAYGVTKAFKEQALVNSGIRDRRTLERRGREAARKATISTVRALLGVPIDHFAEVNLAGFYDLATALGGVEVCLKKPVQDRYSGANFPAGRQHLKGAQALAFVRQRHGLPNGDLDRTRRQQAFLASVTHKLNHEGVFSDLGKMRSLLEVAKKDVVMDKGWDVLSFAQQAGNLTSGNVTFHTLPIKGYAMINGQSVNLIDPAAIKTIVRDAIGPKKQESEKAGASAGGSRGAPSASPATVDVMNGTGQAGLAAKVAASLSGAGYVTGAIGNTTSRATTAVRYGAGAGADAKKIAGVFGVTATPDPVVSSGHVEIDLGQDARVVPQVPSRTSTQAATRTPTPQPSTVVNGGGIPCVD